MKNVILLIALVLLIYSCKKEKETTYTIKGQINNCNNGVLTPSYTNRGIDLFQQKNRSNFNSKVLANTTTDAQGNFTFTYNTDNTFDKLIIRASSGYGFSTIMEGIPLGDLGDLKIILPAYNLVVGLTVTKPYTINDTLVYGKPNSGADFKIAGPFVTGRLFKAVNVLLSNLSYGINEDYIPYKINDPFGQFIRKTYAIENSKLCGDTVFVNIDIK